MRTIAALIATTVAFSFGVARAEDASPDFKFTATGFKFSESGSGVDLNLRHSSDFGNAWIGFFRAPKKRN